MPIGTRSGNRLSMIAAVALSFFWSNASRTRKVRPLREYGSKGARVEGKRSVNEAPSLLSVRT